MSKTSKTVVYAAGSIVASLVLFGACAAAAAPGTPINTPGNAPVEYLPTNDATADVVVTECGNADQFGLNTVTVRVTNPTDRAQSYLVTVSLNDASGARLGEANGASNALAPGQSATAELLGTVSVGADSCTVAQVTRIPL